MNNYSGNFMGVTGTKLKICRQCGEPVNIEESQSGCRDPHCPFITEADLSFDDLDD